MRNAKVSISRSTAKASNNYWEIFGHETDN
jgi:hypothetical protein